MIENHLDLTDIALKISATMKRPQKIQSQKNQPLKFSKQKIIRIGSRSSEKAVTKVYRSGGGVPQNRSKSLLIKWVPA